MEAIERIRGFACEVNDETWTELVKVADEFELEIGWSSRVAKPSTDGSNKARLNEGGYLLGCYGDDLKGCTLIPFEEFLAKLKGEPQQTTTHFAEQVAANIIKISCNNKTPYADKMKMVVQAILEFERDPKNRQPKNEKE